MPTVIADSSAFIHLGAIGRVQLLRDLFGQILVPPAVWQEVVEAGQGRAGDAELRQGVQEGWVSIETPPPSTVLPAGSPPLPRDVKGLLSAASTLSLLGRGLGEGEHNSIPSLPFRVFSRVSRIKKESCKKPRAVCDEGGEGCSSERPAWKRRC